MDFCERNGLGGEFCDDHYGIVEGADRDPGLDPEFREVDGFILVHWLV